MNVPLGDDNEAGWGPDLMLTTACSDFGSFFWRVVTSTLIEGISNAAAKCVMVSKILASIKKIYKYFKLNEEKKTYFPRYN
jgi:hypothetical protein